jgi:integrase/recombinase XerD
MKIRERCRLRDRGDGFLPSPAVVHGGWPRYTLGWTPREKCVKNSYPREEEESLIKHAYRMKGERGLLIKTLFQTGARVSELVNIKAEDVFFEEQMILIAKAKGGKSRYVPILPELAQELRTHLGQRTVGYLFETNRATRYSPRRIQYIVKETAAQAQITKRVYPHLLRHSVATTFLERGMPIEQIQKFLGHSKLETTQVYAESSTEMMRESYQRALGR